MRKTFPLKLRAHLWRDFLKVPKKLTSLTLFQIYFIIKAVTSEKLNLFSIKLFLDYFYKSENTTKTGLNFDLG